MRTLKTQAVVDPNGQLRLQLQVPPDIPPGEYQVVLVIEEQPTSATAAQKRPPLNFPVDDWGPWSATLSLRREDMYDDDR